MSKTNERKFITNEVTFANCKIMYRNLKGEKGPFNPAGKRDFAVIIDDPKVVDNLIADGWAVKFEKPRENDKDYKPRAYMKCNIRYDFKPPQIYLISGEGANQSCNLLREEQIGMIDDIDIINVDLIVRPYNWEQPQLGKSGVSAYVKSMYVTMKPDPFFNKYHNVSGQTPIQAQEQNAEQPIKQ